MNVDWILHDTADNTKEDWLLKFPAGVSAVERKGQVISYPKTERKVIFSLDLFYLHSLTAAML